MSPCGHRPARAALGDDRAAVGRRSAPNWPAPDVRSRGAGSASAGATRPAVRVSSGAAQVDYQLGLCEEAAGCPDRARRPGLGSRRVAIRRDGGPGRDRMLNRSSTAAGSRPWRNSSRRPVAARARTRLDRGSPSPGSCAIKVDSTRSKACSGMSGPRRGPVPHAARSLDARGRAGPDRDGTDRARKGGGTGSRRRPGLAGAGESGDLVRAARGGGSVAEGMPRAASA